MKKKLLWIEDDALLGSIVSKELQKTEFEVTLVKDGRQALETLRSMVPDLILVDLLLPGETDGFGVLAGIQNDTRLKNVPRIVLSNLSDQKDIDRARTLGATTFIVKATSSLDLIVDEIRAQVNKM